MQGVNVMKSMVSTDMKRINRKIIFDIVRSRRAVTRVELAEMTGMSGPSIMTIVNEFIERGILAASAAEQKSGTLGRKPVTMLFNPDVIQSVGIEFEGNNLSVGLVNLDGKIRCQSMVKVPQNLGDAFYQALFRCMDKLEAAMTETEKAGYLGIGFGIPGVVDPVRNRIEFAPYVGVREPVDISADMKRIQERYNKPVLIENDVNAGAAGEFYIRRGREKMKDFLYISVGAGIGAGIILDGRLRHGTRNMCGEIGYTLNGTDQTAERTKNGWLESMISQEALSARFEDYRLNGAVGTEMITFVTQLLSPVIANIANTLDIDQIVIGGSLTVNGGDALFDKIREDVQRLTLSEVNFQRCCTDYTGVVGSALLASDRLLDTIF